MRNAQESHYHFIIIQSACQQGFCKIRVKKSAFVSVYLYKTQARGARAGILLKPQLRLAIPQAKLTALFVPFLLSLGFYRKANTTAQKAHSCAVYYTAKTAGLLRAFSKMAAGSTRREHTLANGAFCECQVQGMQ